MRGVVGTGGAPQDQRHHRRGAHAPHGGRDALEARHPREHQLPLDDADEAQPDGQADQRGRREVARHELGRGDEDRQQRHADQRPARETSHQPQAGLGAIHHAGIYRRF
jgi:hypothetical protein